MRKIFSGLLVFMLLVTLLPMGRGSAATTADYYYPKLYDVYFGNDQEVKYGDTLTVYARVDNQGYEVKKIRLQMKSTTSMATFVITMNYDSSAGQWVGQRKIDESSWIGSSWIADSIIVEDNAGHSRIYSQHDRYMIGEFFNWNDLLIHINPPDDSSQIQVKAYQGTVWKDKVVDLTSDFTNEGTLIIENSTIKSNGFAFTNNGTIILKGNNTFYVKDGWDGYRGYGELILQGPWFHEIGTEAAAMPRINRVTNENSDVITGYGEIGATISIYDTNREQLYGTGIVGEDMRFSVQLADKLEGGSFSSGLYISMKGQAPKEGSTYAEIWDVVAPSTPELYTVNELTTKVKGSTNESSTIFIKRDYNSKPIAQGHTDDNLQFSIDVPKQEVGDHFIVTAIDFDGNESELRHVKVAPKGAPTELSGTYSNAVIYAEDSPYLVNGEVTFTNQFMQVEPGVEFIAKDSNYPRIKISQHMYAAGRVDAPITFREVPVMGVKGYFQYVHFLNLNKNKNMPYIQIEELSIYDSQVINTNFLAATGTVERSLFLNSPLYFSQTLNYIQKGNWWMPQIKNNTFVMDSQRFEQAGLYYEPALSIHGYREVPAYAVKYNNFVTPEGLPNIVSFASPNGAKLDLTNNYWGTTDLNTIKQVKLGGDDNILVDPILHAKAEGTIDYSLPTKPLVETINNDERVVKGKASPGHTVKIIMDKMHYFTVQADVDGTFTYQIPYKIMKDTNILVYQLDQTGIASDSVTAVVIDITPPAAPRVDEVTELSEAVTGTAEAFATIEIRANAAVVATGSATTTGSFSVAIPKQKAGTALEVTAIDNSGNASEKTTAVVKDVTAPAPPQVHEVTDKDIIVIGETEPGAVVEVQTSGSVIASGTADKDGKFSVTIPVQNAGQEIAVTAADQAGNISKAAIVVVKDVTAPAKPVVYAVTEWDTTAWGEAEPNSIVEVSVDGNVVGTGTTDEYGHFYASFPQQKAGTILIFTVKDKAGNVSVAVEVVVRDATAPAAPVVNQVTDKDTTVTGQAEPGAFIEVKQYGTVMGSGTVGADGKFSVVISLPKAEAILKITATDKDGNVSEAATVVVKDVTAPAKPVVNEVTDKDTFVSGQAEPYSSIEVRVGETETITTTLGSDGKFKYTISVQKAGTKIVVFVTDKAGHVSEHATVVVKDTTAPVKPTVNDVNNKSTVVTGTAEVGSTVEVKANGSVLGTGVAGTDGKYIVNVTAQASGTELSVTTKDEAGNVSEVTKVVVSKVSLSGWFQEDSKWYFYDLTTGEKKVGWFKEGGTWYYFATDGVMKTGWLQDGGTWYYFKGSGAMATGWVQDGSAWYYFRSTGAMATGWVQDRSTWYYFRSTGAMATGWVQDGSTWYYFRSTGAMATGWVQDGSTWYYFQRSGAMQTGWLYTGGQWYYFKSGGAMQTGWAYISGKWYYFDSNGVLR
ncbi:Ig-like domain-containing protein [Bacillus salipaludis]|uniref:Ig-like domain-containing protein n=1 Tax=Bacillus salipaludis TaxID=2547811 RepID=A0ABW8RQ48_9BACI